MAFQHAKWTYEVMTSFLVDGVREPFLEAEFKGKPLSESAAKATIAQVNLAASEIRPALSDVEQHRRNGTLPGPKNL